MPNIGEIITQDQLLSLEAWSKKNFTQRGYLAPTVYRYATTKQTIWPYFKTLSDASLYINHITGKSTVKPVVAGTVKFDNAGKAETLGINVDFYYYLPVIGWISLPYAVLKSNYSKNIVIPFRFYKTDGSGPFYSVLVNTALGITATPVNNVSSDKLTALDEFHRQVQLLKAQYNTLAIYLNSLSKRELTKVEQQSFNEGLLLMNNLKEQMRTITGVQFSYAQDGSISGIGIAPLLIILLAVIASGAIAWTVDRITTEKQKTARINAAFDMNKWIITQRQKVAAAIKSGLIDPQTAALVNADLNNASTGAASVITAANKESEGFTDKIEKIAWVALIIWGISKFKN